MTSCLLPARSDAAHPPVAGAVCRALDLLVERPGPLALAVSGGSDSTALLVIASDWARRRGRALLAATVNHGLRAEAAAEAESVARLCADLQVPHATLVWTPSGHVDQARARRARHALLAQWASSRGAETLALGHTEDDRIETLLLRIRAGSGWYGLASPLPSAPSPAWPEGAGVRLVRPLLTARRSDLRGVLTAQRIAWIEDPSNLSHKHERVRIRARIAALPPEARASAVRTANGFAQLRSRVMAEARGLLDTLVRPDPDGWRIDRAGLRRASVDARLRLLETLLMAMGGAETPPRYASLETLLADIVDAGETPRPRTLGHVDVRVKGSDLVLKPAPPRRNGPAAPARPSVERAHALLANPRIEVLETADRDAGSASDRDPSCDLGADMRSFVTSP